MLKLRAVNAISSETIEALNTKCLEVTNNLQSYNVINMF